MSKAARPKGAVPSHARDAIVPAARSPLRGGVCFEGPPMIPQNLADLAPTSEDVTPYDREHFPLYLELIDAIDEGALIDELCTEVLRIDPGADRERAVTCLES